MAADKQASATEQFLKENLKTEQKFKSGANWFFWIAGLSLINSIIILAGGEWGFIIGLGITQFIDAVGMVLAGEVGVVGSIIAFIFDLFAAGVFVAFGILSRLKHRWAFIAGMVLYTLDGLIFLLVRDFLGIGFHVLALFFMYGGLKACTALKQAEKAAAQAGPAGPTPPPVGRLFPPPPGP